MSAVLRALEERAAAGNPIRVGVVGAGYAARGFVARMVRRTPGIRIAAISNRTVAQAERAFRDAGLDEPARVASDADLASALRAGRPAVTLCAGRGPRVASREGTIRGRRGQQWRTSSSRPRSQASG